MTIPLIIRSISRRRTERRRSRASFVGASSVVSVLRRRARVHALVRLASAPRVARADERRVRVPIARVAMTRRSPLPFRRGRLEHLRELRLLSEHLEQRLVVALEAQRFAPQRVHLVAEARVDSVPSGAGRERALRVVPYERKSGWS
eukprot:30899-Pelagococcus_subviridis.AAC.2